MPRFEAHEVFFEREFWESIAMDRCVKRPVQAARQCLQRDSQRVGL
jgi:hypothetical protein